MTTTTALAVIFLMLGFLLVEALRSRHLQKKSIKHDETLFPFCQLRRDIIRFLHESTVEKKHALSREEYAAACFLLNIVSNTIHHYDRHKIVRFNLRKMIKHLKKYRHTVKQAMPPKLPDNPQILQLYDRFAFCGAKAFLAYTPLIRSEFALRVLVLVYRAKHREYVLTVAKQVRDTFENSNAGNTAAAI